MRQLNWRNILRNTVRDVVVVALTILVVWIVIACQPKTVFVERVDGELVTVEEPLMSPIVIVDRHLTVRIGSYDHKVYRLVDLDEGLSCGVLAYGTQAMVYGCRTATQEELKLWR